jgi:hypothetical protein
MIEHKVCVLISSTDFVWDIYHSKKNWARYDKKFILVFISSTSYFCQILMILQFSQQIFEKYSIWNLTFWHQSFTFNSNKSPTWCNSFSVYYPDVCLQLNMFRTFSRPSLGAQWLQWQPLVLPRGESCAVFVVGAVGRPDHEHNMTITTIRR